MALFPGEELVPVDTPNGQVMLPKSVAGGLAIAPPPQAPDVQQIAPQGPGGGAPASGNALAGVPSVADLEHLPPMQAPPTIEHEQERATTPTGPTIVPVDFSAPAAPPKAAAPGSPAKTPPPGAPQVPADPFDVDRAKVDAATAQGTAAEQQIGEAKSAGARDAAQAYKAAAVDQQRIMDDYRQSHVETQAKIAEADDFIKKNTQKIADAKIDRTHDHETMAFIGIALTGLGNALAGKGDAANPAIDLYFKSIDRKVKAQMDELDKTGKIVGLTQQQVDNLRKGLGDNKMLSDFLLTAQTQRHANILNQIAQTTSSDVVKAEALKGVAALNQRAAEFGAGLTEKKVNRDIQREQMATQIKTANISAGATLGAAAMHLQGQREQIASNERIHEEANATAMANKIAELNAKGEHEKATRLAKAQEENVKGGVGRIGGSGHIYNKDGQEKLDAALQLEQEAASLEKSANTEASPFKIDVGQQKTAGPLLPSQTPAGKAQMIAARANALRAKAADLRVDAQTTGVWRIDNPETKREVVNQYVAANNISKLTSDVLRKYDESGGKAWISTNAGQAEVQTMIVELLMAQKEAWKLGVLSAGEITQLQKAGLEDPTRAWDKNAVGNLAHKIGVAAGRDPEAFKAQLTELSKRNEEQVKAKFQAHGFTGDVKSLFVNYDPPKSTPAREAQKTLGGNLTVEQQEAGNTSSTAQKIGKGIVAAAAAPIAGAAGAVGGYIASESGSAKPESKWGLDEAGTKAVTTILEQYKNPQGKNPQERAAARQEAEDFLRQNAVTPTASGKTSKAYSVMTALKTEAPDLYEKLLPEVKAVDPLFVPARLERDAQLGVQAGAMKVSAIKEVGQAAREGDMDAYRMLQQQASSNKDARAELAKVNEALAIKKISPSRKPDYSDLSTSDPNTDRTQIQFPPSRKR